MIKTIIFDVGGTYMAGSMIEFVNLSYKVLDINKKFIADEEIVFDKQLNTGSIKHEECFKKFFKTPISKKQMAEIKKIWMTTWKPTDEMIELVKSLKKNYTLAVLSNSDSLNSKKYEDEGWYSYFKYLILSHEVGIIKPDKKIYEITLKKLKLPANECLMIDDQKKVLDTAKMLGMKTICFKSLAQLKKELNMRGVKY